MCLLAQTVHVFNHLALPTASQSVMMQQRLLAHVLVNQGYESMLDNSICRHVVCFVSGNSQLCDLDVSDHFDASRMKEAIET